MTQSSKLTKDQLAVDPKHATHSGGKGEYLHDWYPYLEGYSSEFVLSALETYLPNAKTILEPFAGVGTTPISLSLNRVKCFYSEINPAMRKVIAGKTLITLQNKSQRSKLCEDLQSLSESLPADVNASQKAESLETSFNNAFGGSHYFDKKTFLNILKLRNLNEHINSKNPLLGNALEIAVISKLIICSRLKRAGDVRYKTEKELAKGLPDLIHSVQGQLKLMALDCLRCPKSEAKPKLLIDNAKDLCSLEPKNLDGVITSPPYLNGTNYFRNTKLELWYMGFITTNKCLRGFRDEVVTSGINDVTVDKGKVIHPAVRGVVEELAKRAYDSRIPKMAASYFEEMRIVFSGLSKHLKPGSIACIDIGDSVYGGVHVPTDSLLIEIAKEYDFKELDKVILRQRRSKSGAALTQSLLVLEKTKLSRSK